ncbi:GPI10 [Candida margitis]|uniref:GPI10 n=1 Tax=Candida margitis TaxID=1775924 RepID=UPI0022279CAD|nr:GPI10 [Candida margitis]KAI5962021.1 GPI10 [Candida margitis]
MYIHHARFKLPSSLQLFCFIFIFRLVNAISIQTFFQADEYYQSLEPAHHFVYQYGYITWEWHAKLRSSIHPLIYSLGYKIAQQNEQLIWFSPKLINALIATITEYQLSRFVQVYSRDSNLARITLTLSLLNPFNWYVLTRSFSNNLETCLTICAMRYWPWRGRISGCNWYLSLAFGFMSCTIRPTNVILWVPLGVWLLAKSPVNFAWVAWSILEVCALFSSTIALDYYFYQEFTIPLYNFLQFNVVKNLSIFYGVAPWHFYLFQAVPLMMMIYLPLLFYGLRKDILLFSSIIYLAGFSLIQHKEFRFIMPLQPIMLYYAARGYQKLKRFKQLAPLVVLLNIIIGIFFTNVNERGVIDILDFMKTKGDASFGFLTPCHSTPWQSHLHNPNLRAWFLTCEPPLHLSNPTSQELKSYRDQSDMFYDNPRLFIKENLGSSLEYPDYVIVFSPLKELVEEELGNYVLHKRYFNSYFHWDSRRNGDLIVFKRKKEA